MVTSQYVRTVALGLAGRPVRPLFAAAATAGIYGVYLAWFARLLGTRQHTGRGRQHRLRRAGRRKWLTGQYTVFGEVIDGMNVVERISELGGRRSLNHAENRTDTVSAHG